MKEWKCNNFHKRHKHTHFKSIDEFVFTGILIKLFHNLGRTVYAFAMHVHRAKHLFIPWRFGVACPKVIKKCEKEVAKGLGSFSHKRKEFWVVDPKGLCLKMLNRQFSSRKDISPLWVISWSDWIEQIHSSNNTLLARTRVWGSYDSRSLRLGTRQRMHSFSVRLYPNTLIRFWVNARLHSSSQTE